MKTRPRLNKGKAKAKATPPTAVNKRAAPPTIINEAQDWDPFEVVKGADGEALKLPKDPLDWARAFVQKHYLVDATPTLGFYRGNWYAWATSHYAALDRGAIANQVLRFLAGCVIGGDKVSGKFRPKPNDVKQTVELLQGMLRLNDKLNAPFLRVSYDKCEPLHGVIMLRNGRLDPATRELTPHDPRVF
jgi:hypothetical protein